MEHENVVHCTLCKATVDLMSYDTCKDIILCKECVQQHFFDHCKGHKMVSVNQSLTASQHQRPCRRVNGHQEQLSRQFGVMSLSSKSQSRPRPASSPSARSLLDPPQIIRNVATGERYLRSVSCVSNDKFWTCGSSDTIKLYNLQGELLKSVTTTSGDTPEDIAVTKTGDLVYVDYNDGSINTVSNTYLHALVRWFGWGSNAQTPLRGWKPVNVCSTSSGDLLVIMDSRDSKQSKVVHYSDSSLKRSIQFDDHGQPLYSSGGYSKYLCENRNLDICVADFLAGAVVVVNAKGRLRFRYRGSPTRSPHRESFNPHGITTDSRGRILAAGSSKNELIHILDQDGHFLRYIDSCGLRGPWGLCVDSRDNLFVAEYCTGNVKKIQYCK